MVKSLFLLLFLAFASLHLFAQNNKASTANAVYSKLVEAFGDGRKPPVLKFVDYKNMRDSVVAAFIPGDAPSIVIDELAYDVCMSFGKDSANALACIIGHELSHYYLKHDWCSNFSKRLSHISLAADLYKSDQAEQLSKESEADYYGFFYGSIAGFKAFDVAPDLLKKIYAVYKLNPNLKGYPTLNKRVEAAIQSKALVLRRLPVFNAGLCLYDIGEFELAFECFNNLLTDFTSRENYNNAAVCKLQSALLLFEPYEMPFCFPFELDYESRIFSSTTRYGTLDRSTERKQLLMDAKKLLEESIRKDASYTKAKINLAICYILLNNLNMALGIAQEFDDSMAGERSVITAIVTAKNGDLKGALNELNSLDNSRLAHVVNSNKKVFETSLQYNLSIGSDELGYQLKKLGRVSSIYITNSLNPNDIVCFDSTSKSLVNSYDSIPFPSSTLYFIKGDRNYSRVTRVKSRLSDRDYYIYKPSSLDVCKIEKQNVHLHIDKAGSFNQTFSARHSEFIVSIRR